MSCDARFNNIIGFSEQELKQSFFYYKNAGDIPDSIDDLIAMMKPWYDNYCFSTVLWMNQCIIQIWCFTF